MMQAECGGERLPIMARESRLDRRMRRVSWRRLRKCAAPVGAPSLCITAILAIGGCAPSPADWTRPGMTGVELRRDLADCERQATGPGPFRFKALSEDYETARDQIGPRAGSMHGSPRLAAVEQELSTRFAPGAQTCGLRRPRRPSSSAA